jgi:hypothetical protein
VDFLRRRITPRVVWRFECRLAPLLWEIGRLVMQQSLNRIEPDDRQALPCRLRLGQDEYRRNRQTPHDVFCLFGRLRLRRWIYQAVTAGEPGLCPLEQALGIVAGLATPALADVVGRLSAELTQEQTLAVLKERYGVCWSVGSLRKVAASLAEALTPLMHEAQVSYLVDLLRKAYASRGKFRPALVVGRDGVMVPMRPFWEEAATATLSMYDRGGRRLGTVYLGRMPELGQSTLTEQLTRLILAVLTAWDGPLPRLHYVTDAGHHPQDYFRNVLRKMIHPRTTERLQWTWAVDYYHACERLTKIAEALFGAGREATAWAEKMRRVLKTKSAGVTRVLQSAQALRRRYGLRGAKKDFTEAVRYLSKYRDHMNYAAYQRVRLAIGSGVTEAACKTIFGYRFKQSGMRWKKDPGQHILDLRLILKSSLWPTVRQRWLATPTACRPTNATRNCAIRPQKQLSYVLPA